MSAVDETPERAAFEEALHVVIAERDAWRIAGKFAVEAFNAYLDHDYTVQRRYYRPDARRAVEELTNVLKLSLPK